MRIEGLALVNRAIEIANNEAKKLTLKAVTEIIDQSTKEAKKKVPVDTAALKLSIEGRVTDYDLDHIQGVVGAGQKSIRRMLGGKSGKLTYDYAHYVEYGTSKMRARPYMNPAYELAKKETPKNLDKKLKEIYG